MTSTLDEVKQLLVQAGIEGVDSILEALGALDLQELTTRASRVVKLRLQGKQGTTEYQTALGDLVDAVCDAMLEAEAKAKAHWEQAAKGVAGALLAGFVSGVLHR